VLRVALNLIVGLPFFNPVFGVCMCVKASPSTALPMSNLAMNKPSGKVGREGVGNLQ